MAAQHQLEVWLTSFNVPGPVLHRKRVYVLRGPAGAAVVVSPDGDYYEESAVPDVDVAETVQLAELEAAVPGGARVYRFRTAPTAAVIWTVRRGAAALARGAASGGRSSRRPGARATPLGCARGDRGGDPPAGAGAAPPPWPRPLPPPWPRPRLARRCRQPPATRWRSPRLRPRPSQRLPPRRPCQARLGRRRRQRPPAGAGVGDLRCQAARVNAAGQRWRDFGDGFALSSSTLWPDFHARGTSLALRVGERARRRAKSPNGLAREAPRPRGASVRATPLRSSTPFLCQILELTACHDRVNFGGLARLELAARRF